MSRQLREIARHYLTHTPITKYVTPDELNAAHTYIITFPYNTNISNEYIQDMFETVYPIGKISKIDQYKSTNRDGSFLSVAFVHFQWTYCGSQMLNNIHDAILSYGHSELWVVYETGQGTNIKIYYDSDAEFHTGAPVQPIMNKKTEKTMNSLIARINELEKVRAKSDETDLLSRIDVLEKANAKLTSQHTELSEQVKWMHKALYQKYMYIEKVVDDLKEVAESNLERR